MGTKREKGRKKEERGKWKKARKKGIGKENCYPVIFFGLGKINQALNQLENT